MLYVSYESGLNENAGFNAAFELLPCKMCQWKRALKNCDYCHNKEDCLKVSIYSMHVFI